jgi:hypothetical protein
MSEDPTRPLPGRPEQPGRPGQSGGTGQAGTPGGYGSPGAYGPPDYGGADYGAPDYGAPQDGYRSPQATSRMAAGGYDGGAVRRGGRGRRRLTITAIVVLVVLILLVIADRAAAAYAENRIATQIKTSGFPVKPKVTIAGFPFLTQIAARDVNQMTISASNVPEGPLDIASVNATLHGVHINSSFNGATIDQLNGTALITFAGLSQAAGVGDGITLSDGGNNQVKASVNLGFLSGTALFQVTRTSGNAINVRVVSAGGLPTSALGSLQNFNVPIPKLPAGMSIQSVSVTGQGVLINLAGSHTTLSQ